jgi:hypothetical protein
MLDRFSESDLLALIEDELEVAAARDLEALLGEDAIATIRAMRADRARLRALPEVEPPIDFIAALEPRLARPMLMEVMPGVAAGPGSFRRRHHRAGRRRRIVRFAFAAVLFLGLGASVWTMATALMNRPARQPVAGIAPDVDERSPNLARDAREAGSPDGSTQPKLTVPSTDAFVYHRAPLPDRTVVRADPKLRPNVAGTRAAGAPPRVISAEFALSIMAEDIEDSERQVGEAVVASLQSNSSAGAARMAFVRNFNDAEATALLNRYLPLTLARDESPSAYSSLTRPPSPASSPDDLRKRRHGQADRLNRLRGQQMDDGSEILPSRQLMGSRELAPSFSDQLALSGRGATHAIIIPATQVAGVLEAIDARTDGHALRALVALEAPGERSTGRRETTVAAALADQMEALRAARALMEQVAALDDPEAYVLLPVVIEPKPQR